MLHVNEVHFFSLFLSVHLSRPDGAVVVKPAEYRSRTARGATLKNRSAKRLRGHVVAQRK